MPISAHLDHVRAISSGALGNVHGCIGRLHQNISTSLIIAAGVIASMIATRPTHEEKRPATPSPARTVA